MSYQRLARRMALIALFAAGLFGIGVNVALAAPSAVSPSPVQMDTTTLYWSGEGAPVTQMCGISADPGAGGYQNGATAGNYMLWIFTTDGGSVSGSPTLTINGTTYDHAYGASSSTWQIVTPYVDPATITRGAGGGAYTTFTVNLTGNGSWDLTISHGCSGTNKDLTVTKTATPSFTRAYTWGITKAVDKTEQDIAGGSATFNYAVDVTHDTGTDRNWQVTGDITVANPNSTDFTGVSVSDAIDNGGSCTVSIDPSGATIPASGSVDFPYTCTYSAAPSPSSFTNTATATWSKTDFKTPDGSATGTATGDFANVAPTIIDGSVSVSDTLGGTLGTVSYTDPSPTTFTYSKAFSGSPGTCTSYDNTATFTTNTTGTTGSASQTVKVCVGADLTVAKDATPAFTRTYNWDIAKKVTPTFVQQVGGTVTANYTVTADETGFTDSGWQVTGKITVTNPNDWEAVTADVTDAIDNGGTCAVTGGTGVSVPASGNVVLPYTCTYSSAPNPSSGTNTATVTWDSGAAFTPDNSATGTAAAAFGAPTTTVGKTITVTDLFGGSTTTLGTLTATDSVPFASATYQYTHTLNVPAYNCVTYPNTATIVETGQTADAQVKLCGPAQTGALTMGFWQNKNGQAIITGGASTSGVCNSGTWLRQYAPFQDLSATASCSTVAAYVTTVIKAANASGASMNAMLKAQMLSTALDVYFSDPALGGNKIGAPAPVGGVSIDLTKVCANPTTCTSYENTSPAFGGATSLTISQILAYAASQSNVGGSTWYGNVKATQGLAKDTFDAINNQVAFGA